MLKQKFKDWLNKQQNISEQTKKDYFHRLEKICYQSVSSNVSNRWEYFATHIFEFIEEYQNSNLDKSNDVSAMKKFNEFLYENQYSCQLKCVKDIKSVMKMLYWFAGSETQAPEIRTTKTDGSEDLLTPTQVAYYLKVTTKTLREWRQQNKFLSYRDMPYGVRYQRQTINALLKSRFHEILIKK